MSDAPRWNRWNEGGGPKYPHEKVVQFVFRTFPRTGRDAIRVLDLGCGSGVHTQFLAGEGFVTFARDLSEVGVANTRARLTAAGLSADVAVGTVAAIDLPEASVDGVISVGVLDCAGAAVFGAAVAEVTRVLAPGGTALLLFASDEDFRVQGPNELGLYGFTDADVEVARRAVLPQLEYFWRDRYVTTYQDRAIQQNDHLLTLRKARP